MKTNGNTILITGGSSGIGFEMAKNFLSLGNTVVITGRNIEKLDKAKKSLEGVFTFQCDVSNPKEVKELYQNLSIQFPEINILINNAGVMSTIDLQDHDLTPVLLTREIDINLKGAIWMADAFLPMLTAKANAAIVFVSSALAYVPLPVSPVYCATKAGVHSFAQSMRAQLMNTGVKVFELAPPATKTDMLSGFNEDDMKGITPMMVEDLVRDFLKGFSKDSFEICPGQSSQLKFMSRFFPTFITKQMRKTVYKMHKKKK
jgi:uncharacterized oxidoreductase